MSNNETSIAYENLNRRIFDGVGEYGIPQIHPETFEGNCKAGNCNGESSRTEGI